VVFGEALADEIVAVLARTGTLTKVATCPSGQAHHCCWHMGGQLMGIRNGYFQGGTQLDRDASDKVLAEWLEASEVSGEPTLIAGDFNATQAELPVSRWFAAAGWQELGGLQQPATCLPSKGQPRRIDWLLASRGLLPAIRGPAQVRWDIGVKPHAVQVVKVCLTERRKFPKWHGATPLASMAGERPPAEARGTPTPQQSQQHEGSGAAAGPRGPTAEHEKQQRKLRQASNAYWCAEAWIARRSQWQQAWRNDSVEAAWEVFWQTTLDLHDAASAGSQGAWLPCFTRVEQEMQQVKAGRAADCAEGLLVRRIGQVESLCRVATDTGAAQAVIRRQLARKLRANVQCPQVPPATANLLDPWARKHLIAQTKAVLERHRVAAAVRRRDGWHTWLAEQAATGNRKTFAWIRQEEAK
jgi:hypothetical protein